MARMAEALAAQARRSGALRCAIRAQGEYTTASPSAIARGARVRWTDLRMSLGGFEERPPWPGAVQLGDADGAAVTRRPQGPRALLRATRPLRPLDRGEHDAEDAEREQAVDQARRVEREGARRPEGEHGDSGDGEQVHGQGVRVVDLASSATFGRSSDRDGYLLEPISPPSGSDISVDAMPGRREERQEGEGLEHSTGLQEPLSAPTSSPRPRPPGTGLRSFPPDGFAEQSTPPQDSVRMPIVSITRIVQCLPIALTIRLGRRAQSAHVRQVQQSNWHGHNYVLELTVEGEVDPETGFVVNLRDVKAVAEREIVDVVDHKNLNLDVPFMQGTIPSTENLVTRMLARPRARRRCATREAQALGDGEPVCRVRRPLRRRILWRSPSREVTSSRPTADPRRPHAGVREHHPARAGDHRRGPASRGAAQDPGARGESR